MAKKGLKALVKEKAAGTFTQEDYQDARNALLHAAKHSTDPRTKIMASKTIIEMVGAQNTEMIITVADERAFDRSPVDGRRLKKRRKPTRETYVGDDKIMDSEEPEGD